MSERRFYFEEELLEGRAWGYRLVEAEAHPRTSLTVVWVGLWLGWIIGCVTFALLA